MMPSMPCNHNYEEIKSTFLLLSGTGWGRMVIATSIIIILILRLFCPALIFGEGSSAKIAYYDEEYTQKIWCFYPLRNNTTKKRR